MLRVRLALIFAGLIIVFAAHFAIALPPTTQAVVLLGAKLMVLPFALEYSLYTFSRCAPARVALGGVRVVLYGVALMIIVGTTLTATQEPVRAPAHLALVVATFVFAELLARLTRWLVAGAMERARARQASEQGA